jgi:glyoxylase-like metal-dependent hydrolase (beta-lactamase superfamily II)
MEVRESGIRYPFADPPAMGHAQEVIPGVLWIRLAMPMTLDHINVWAIEDGDGYTLVDTGLFTDKASDLWGRISQQFLRGRRIKRVIVTHAHEDHIGTAGWFSQTAASELWVTDSEYLDAKDACGRHGQEPPEDYLQFYRSAGTPAEMLTECRLAYGKTGRWMHPLPTTYRPLIDGENFVIGDHRWCVVTGSGHSSQHACLYCPELLIFISGDQVLPGISSNVSVRWTEPEDDPLCRWYASIHKLSDCIPDNVVVLPAHNLPFIGLHSRLDALRKGHDATLERLLKAVESPKRTIDLFPVMFRREIKGSTTFRLAVGESLAHLNYLRVRGKIARDSDVDGVHLYARI